MDKVKEQQDGYTVDILLKGKFMFYFAHVIISITLITLMRITVKGTVCRTGRQLELQLQQIQLSKLYKPVTTMVALR